MIILLIGTLNNIIIIIRAALLRVRGSRTKWRSLEIVDGASLPMLIADS